MPGENSGRRADQDTPTSNVGLLANDNEKPGSPNTSPAKKVPGGPRFAKNGNVVCQVTMLDGHDVDIELSKSAKGQDLVDKACASFELLEKDYFSCSYLVDGVKFWINHERRISKQIKNFVWNFKFEVKFYPSDPNTMSEDLTRYQLFLQVRTDIYNGLLPCSFVTYCLLGSLAAQSEYGDYDPQEVGEGFQYLADSAPYAPSQLQNEEMLEKICELHKSHRGIPPAEAELTYLENAKLLALYGVDMHKAKDENHSEVSVGVSCHGLNVYREKLRLHRFPWAKILKIAYKRNCFFIKIRPAEKAKTEPQTLTYKLINHTMAKRLWKTAVEHHSFFRLKEPEPPKRGMFPLFGSKFRYSGRTQFQTRSESTHIDRKTPTIDRAASRRYARDVVAKNYETEGPSSSTDRVEEVVAGNPHTATLDLKNLRKNKLGTGGYGGTMTPTVNGGGDPDKNLEYGMSAVDHGYEGSVTLTNQGGGGGGMGGAGGMNFSSVSYTTRQQQQTTSTGGFTTTRQLQYDQYGNLIRNSGEDDDDSSNMPPYSEDQHLLKGSTTTTAGKLGSPYVTTSSTKTTTRTYRGPDGTMVTEHKVEKNGVVETNIEKKTLMSGGVDVDDDDEDKALRDAIFAVTNMNPDLSVEKIEIRTERQQQQQQ